MRKDQHSRAMFSVAEQISDVRGLPTLLCIDVVMELL